MEKKRNLQNLAQGMIELSPPQTLRNLASELMREESDVHTYRNRFGEIEYREALVKLLKEYYNTENIAFDNILATSGVRFKIAYSTLFFSFERFFNPFFNKFTHFHKKSGAIYATLTALKKEGKTKVGVTNPFYTYHERQVMEITGNKPEYLQLSLDEDWNPDWNQLEKLLKGGMKGLIVCNPGNPSGAVLSEEQLKKYIEMTHEHQCYIIFDEIYADLVWPPNKLHSALNTINLAEYPYVVVCRGFSKNLGCQSWRLGYAIANPETIKKLMVTHDPIYISVPLQQHAVGKYLSQHIQDYAEHVNKEQEMMQANLKILSEAFSKAFGWKLIAPRGSMYACFFHNSKTDLAAVLLGLEKGVGIAPGSMFFHGNPENSKIVRIHLGISTEKAKKIAENLLK